MTIDSTPDEKATAGGKGLQTHLRELVRTAGSAAAFLAEKGHHLRSQELASTVKPFDGSDGHIVHLMRSPDRGGLLELDGKTLDEWRSKLEKARDIGEAEGESGRVDVRAALKLLDALEAARAAPEGDRFSTCPCTLVKPCKANCTCARGLMSGGCLRCATYGSREQQIEAATRLSSTPAPVRAPTEDGPGLWFSSNPVTQDLVFHESEAAAKQAAEEAVDDLEEQVADDNYLMNENGAEGCYGRVIARVAEFRKDVKDDPEKAYDEEISFELKPIAVPTGPSDERAILEEIEQRLGIERDAEAEKAEGRWSKLGKGMDRLIEDRPCPHGMRLWKNCIECTPDPSPAGPARRTWPVLECEDCDGAGHLGETTVDTSSGPSGRKIACETCGGNEDSLGRGWIEIVTVAPSNDTEYICAACRETCDATVRHACTAPTAGAGMIISVSDFRRAFQDIIDRTLATGRYPARVRTEMRTMIEAIPAAGDSEPATTSPAAQALKLESARYLGDPVWMTSAVKCPTHAGQLLDLDWQKDGRILWLCSVCTAEHRAERKRGDGAGTDA